jgi:hypothetical protein
MFMKKALKIVLVVFVALLLLLVGFGVYLGRNLPSIIKTVVEEQAPKVTGTEVSLGGVQIIYGTGLVVVKDLIIKNPPGFTSPHAFWLHKLAFQINIPSVFQDVVIIDEFTLEKINIIAEQVGTSLETNLQVISDNAKASTPASSKQSKGATSTPSKPVKLIIKEFRFVANSVELLSEQWGGRTIAIPDIVLKDIGAKENGLTPDQLSQRIIQLITRHANDALKVELKRLAKEKAKESITGKIKEKWGSLFGGE